MLPARIRLGPNRQPLPGLLPTWVMLSAAAFAVEPSPAQSSGASAPNQAGAPQRIEVEPPTIQLQSRRARRGILVTGHYADGASRDLTGTSQIVVSDANVARAIRHTIVPQGNGRTSITVQVGGQTQTVPVEVIRFEQPDRVSFRNEVLAALTAQGCNSGACHGSPSGKASFRLSLQAYDAELDRFTLIRESLGRRTNLIEPEASLLLLKPLTQVAHGGGKRLRENSAAYDLLRSWISEGCQADLAEAPRCVRLQILPGPRQLRLPHRTQQLVAIAHYADGGSRDVTEITKFSSSDQAVATVAPDGRVIGQRRGEAAIMARYLEQLESTLITVVRDFEDFVWKEPPAEHYVDQHVNHKLRQLRFSPAVICTDSEFLRRAHLDVTGQLPSVEAAKAFLNDSSADKRIRLIDQLLEQPAYASFWALHWADLFRVSNKNLREEGVHKFHEWIVSALEENMPFDAFARALLTARGSTYDNPPANYYRAFKDTSVSTESTAQLFLGVRIECAKCHNHPFENWTQDNYYGLSAFFHRVRKRDGTRPGEQVIWIARQGEVTQPRTGEVVAPWLPGRDAPQLQDGEIDLREPLADWLTDPENPFFARVAVNRIWTHVMGRGIVHPVDDFRASNPPANAELLDALADDFIDSGFDQKHILRTILTSRTYQRSARTGDFNRDDHKYFSRAYVRMLTAEQLLDAICHVAGVPEAYDGLPAGTRAVQLPSPDRSNEFLQAFGQPLRETACACERPSNSNLAQALQLLNSDLIHDKLAAPDNRIRRGMLKQRSDDELITELYLAAYSRRPEMTELHAAQQHLENHENRAAGLEDLAWSLINSKEFLFHH